MTLAVTHATPADTTFSVAGAAAWNAGHSVAGGTAYGILYADSAGALGQVSGLTFGGAAAGTGLAIPAGTATTAVSPLSVTQTWNNAATTFPGFKLTITDTASAAGSLAFQILGGAAGATQLLGVRKDGRVYIGVADSLALQGFFTGQGVIYSGSAGAGTIQIGGSAQYGSNGAFAVRSGSVALNVNYPLCWSSDTNPASGTLDAQLSRLSAGLLAIGTGAAGSFAGALKLSKTVIASGGTTLGDVTTASTVKKTITAIANNTATPTFTVTVPNAAHSASVKLTLKGSLGAGGAIGANEATGSISYEIAIARTAGLATVVGVSTAYGSSTAAVAGAATITITAAASGLTGANSVSQTFTIDVTIARGSGASANHTCGCFATIINANASGVTLT